MTINDISRDWHRLERNELKEMARAWERRIVRAVPHAVFRYS